MKEYVPMKISMKEYMPIMCIFQVWGIQQGDAGMTGMLDIQL